MNWKKRFMVIEPDQGKMSYYVKDDKKSKKGEILFKTIKQVKPYPDYKGRKFVFGIVTTTGRTFFVQAADDSGVDSWMSSIKLACGLESTNALSQSTSNASSPALSSSAPPQPAHKMCYEDFEPLKVIGRGGFGRVLLVRKKDNRQVFLFFSFLLVSFFSFTFVSSFCLSFCFLCFSSFSIYVFSSFSSFFFFKENKLTLNRSMPWRS